MAAALEVADISRRHGEAFRQTHAGHLGRGERRVAAVPRAGPVKVDAVFKPV